MEIRENSQRHLQWLPLGPVGEREMVGRADRQFLGLWEQRQQKWWESLPVMLWQEGQVSCNGVGGSVGL